MVCLLTADIISTALVPGSAVVCGLWSALLSWGEEGREGKGELLPILISTPLSTGTALMLRS